MLARPDNDFMDDLQSASVLPDSSVRIEKLHQEREEYFALSRQSVVILKTKL